MSQELRVTIDDGQAFAADQVSVIHNPLKIVVDFKSVTPRIDMQPKDMRMKLVHNTVTLDPHLAKKFLEVLTTNIENYEKRFGKIKEPASVEKAKKAQKKSANAKTAEVKQDYFG